jgi:hypothetical protein
MPRMSHSGRGIAPWHHCDRCGWQFRVTELKRQLGLILCGSCYDNPIAWYRPIMIQDLLNFTAEEELRIADILKSNQSDDITGLSS